MWTESLEAGWRWGEFVVAEARGLEGRGGTRGGPPDSQPCIHRLVAFEGATDLARNTSRCWATFYHL